MIKECYDIGQRDFGENKVQDLIAKKELLPKDIRWHFIGKLQTNKVKYLVNNVYLIHSLSSIKLLEKIESEFSKSNSSVNALIQINIGREESKSGIYEEELEDMIKAIEACNHVKVKGIMVIIPKGNDEENRYYFSKTKEIFNKLKDRNLKNISMEILSMGMTNDYKIAIQEGATMIRVGSEIFGLREEVEEEEEVEEVEPIISKQRGNKVVNIHNSASAKVMVVKPNSYDEAREIAEAIKNRKIVVVNTTAMETKVAQRLVDFISGACCVLGAQLQEVEQRVYLLSPSNVEVSNELRTEISSKALFNWNK